MLTLPDGRVLTTDTERDQVLVVDRHSSVIHQAKFAAGSGPFRIALGADGHAWVLLREAGAVVDLDVEPGSALGTSRKTSVCDEPRGLAFDPATKAVKIACASGELITISASGSKSTVVVEPDLRDVVVAAGNTFVTTFRSAELLQLNDEGAVIKRVSAAGASNGAASFAPHVAWRTIERNGQIVMVHQLHAVGDVANVQGLSPAAPTAPVPYYGVSECLKSVVSSGLTVFDGATGAVKRSSGLLGTLPVDVAVSASGNTVSIAFAGSGHAQSFDTAASSFGGCLSPVADVAAPHPVASATDDHGDLVTVSQDGTVHTGTEVFGEVSPPVLDAPRTLFHDAASSGVSCASCHPEGYDDGHVWQFGDRSVRSQSLEGGLLKTAPFHWRGEMANMGAVLDETFVKRMGGRVVKPSEAQDLGAWLNTLPARHSGGAVTTDGRAAFEADGCTSCHGSDLVPSTADVDVGTGAAFQPPSLKAVSLRGPWMHDGCATTLEERFTEKCGGAHHGNVPAGDVPVLVKYLKSL